MKDLYERIIEENDFDSLCSEGDLENKIDVFIVPDQNGILNVQENSGYLSEIKTGLMVANNLVRFITNPITNGFSVIYGGCKNLHRIPTWSRKTYENKISERLKSGLSENEDNIFEGSYRCFVIGFYGALSYSFFSTVVVSLAFGVTPENPFILITPSICLGTNVLSGLYELYRNEKNKIKNQSLESLEIKQIGHEK